jgi:hypothetical protein
VIEKDLLQELRKLYNEGHNLTNWIKSNEILMSEELISIIYDLQAGSYTSLAKAQPIHFNSFAAKIAAVISALPRYLEVSTILDCGVGEGTTLIPMLDKLGFAGKVFGFDISVSRASWAALNTKGVDNVQIFVAEMSHIPLPDCSIDLVLTVHALEPNGGQEKLLIGELSRVSARYIVMVEPDFENASSEQKTRMNQLGYIGGLREAITSANLTVIQKIPIEYPSSLLNKASIWVCEKSQFESRAGDSLEERPPGGHHWRDPLYLEPLLREDGWFKSRDGIWYPTLNDLPLLRRNDSVLYLSPPVS